MKFKFVGMFTMLRCIPNCPYLCNWKIYANARHGVMKCSFILFTIKTKVIGELFCFKGYLSLVNMCKHPCLVANPQGIVFECWFPSQTNS